VASASAGPDKSSDNKSRVPVTVPHVGGAAAAFVPHLPGGLGGFHLPGGAEPGGGAHLPSNLAGGAHIPGNMAGGGAYIPGNIPGNGAHIPGNVAQGGAHIPVNMAGGGAHLPGGTTTGAARIPARTGSDSSVHQSGGFTSHDRMERAAVSRESHGHETARGPVAPRAGAERAERGTVLPAHGSEREQPRVAARPGTPTAVRAARIAALPHTDHRLGGNVPMHVNAAALASAPRAAPRRYLHAPVNRDIAADRAFVATHSADFHTRNVREFSASEMHIWRAGLWRNEWHYGRRGWWWEVGGVWYPYPDPVFPFPLEVAALTVYDTPTVDGPDLTGVVDAAPPEAADEAANAGAPAPDAAPPPSEPDAAANTAPASGSAASGTQVAQLAPPAIPPLPPAPRGRYSCADPQGDFPGQNACSVPWDFVSNAPATTLETPP
jgi:hypothetical protein